MLNSQKRREQNTMDRLRAAFDEVVEIVKLAVNGEPKTPVEILLDDNLPLDDDMLAPFSTKKLVTGIPTSVMNDFASRTNNVVDCPLIQARIWEILIDHQHNPNLMKKALNLLQYLLINGSPQVLEDSQSPARCSFLVELAAEYNKYEYEQYEFSQNLDVGAGVRKTSSEINTVLENDDALKQARQKAEKLHQNLSSRACVVHTRCPDRTVLGCRSTMNRGHLLTPTHLLSAQMTLQQGSSRIRHRKIVRRKGDGLGNLRVYCEV